MPTTETDPATQGSRTERFAEYVRRAAQEAGYDIDSPRGGGKKALAEATGMSATSIGRMLSGKTMPDPFSLERLADALGVPLREMLVRSGVVSTRNAPAVPAAVPSEAPSRVPTPAEAARLWGIRSPSRIAMLESLVELLLQEDAKEAGRRVG